MTPDAANAAFDAAELASSGQDGARLLIIDAQGRIVYATQDARELFGAKDRSDLQDRLLAGEGPTARRLSHLTTSLPIGEAPRLERLRYFSKRRPASVNLRCARIQVPDGAAYLVIWAPPAGAGRDATRPIDLAGTAAQAADALGADAPGPSTKPLMKSRFLWSLDKEGRFGASDRVLVAALGANAPLPGETLDALRLRTGLAHGDDLVRAVEERETFSDVPIVWPSASENTRFRIRLSAAPVFERGHDFGGFRGFGRLDEAIGISEGSAAADAATFVDIKERGASAETSDNQAADFRGVAATEETTEVAPTALAGAARADRSPADDPADGSELAPVLPESAEEDGAASERSLEADARLGVETPQGDRPEDARSKAPGEAVNAAPERTAEIYVLRQTHAATSKIVPIRPGALEALAPDPGQGSGGDSVELSKSERDAFREIARALIGRTHNAPRDAEPDGSLPVADSPEKFAEAVGAPASPFPPVEAGQRDEAAAASGPVRRNAWAILDRLPIGVLVARDAQALYLNRTLLDLLGYRDFEHFSASKRLAAMFRGHDPQAVSTKQSGVLEIVRTDGESLAVDGHAQAVNWDGAPATLIAFRRLQDADVDTRPIEEEAWSRNGAAHDLHDMLDRAADGAVTLDSAGRILSLNHPAQKLFGYDEKDVVGESVLMLLAPQSHPETTARLESLSRDGDSSAAGGPNQVVGRDRAGAALSLALTLSRIGPPEAPRYCALMRDMSREQEAARKLMTARDAAQAASAAKTDFLAQVSHEIRTPLHAILGFAEVMIEERFGPIGNERYKDYLKDIHASGAHVMSLADDLLDLSKIEAGKLELAFTPVDANSLIRECVSMMQPQAARERIIVRVSLFERLPRVMVDERSLKQIMLNLMSNAVKFNEPGGQVIVSTAIDAAGQAVIRVRDTGVGMSESEVGLALEPFSQIGRAGRKGGAGLGLPLTKALVEANGAEFSIKSRRDQGTLIEIAFPTVRAA
jgi:PAS domain S-box-containing protein